MLTTSVTQAVPRQYPTTTAPSVDRLVRDTYHSLFNLPVPERFMELVQSCPEQTQARPGIEDRGFHASLLHRCSE